MAAKRLSKSAVDWVKFAEKVPKSQRDFFRSFKAKNDHFVMNVGSYPEAMKKVDFGFYKSRIAAAGLVDQFEKAFASVKVPYPTDNDNVLGNIDQQEKAAEVKTKEYVTMLNQKIAEAKTALSEFALIPEFDELTLDEITEYFPHVLPNENRPTLYPHTPNTQPQNNPDMI